MNKIFFHLWKKYKTHLIGGPTIFWGYWFAYKGMWKEWWILTIGTTIIFNPLIFLIQSTHSDYKSLLIFVAAFFAAVILIAIGRLANSHYKKRFEDLKNINDTKMGVIGLISSLALSELFDYGMRYFL